MRRWAGSISIIARTVVIVGVVEIFTHSAVVLMGVTDRATNLLLDVLLLSVLSAPLLYLFVIKEFGRRVAMAEALEKRAELTGQLLSLMDNVPGVVYRGAPDWSIGFIGAEVKNLTGYAPGEFTGGGVDWRSIIHPDDLELVKTAFSDAVRRKEKTLRVEYRVKHVDGGYRWLEDRRQMIYGAGGYLLSIEGLLLDMTERKSMEETVQNQFHFMQVLLDAIPTPIYYKNTQGRYLGCNKAYEEYVGLSKDHLVGKTVHDIAPRKILRTSTGNRTTTSSGNGGSRPSRPRRSRPTESGTPSSSTRRPSSTPTALSGGWWGPSWTSPTGSGRKRRAPSSRWRSGSPTR